MPMRGFVSCLLIALLCTANTVSAQQTRLELLITEEIGMTNGVQCKLLPAQSLGKVSLSLNEHDVIEWNPDNAHWTIKPTKIRNPHQSLFDHCFVLNIDGVRVASGMVLSSHSARLVTFPVLNIFTQNGTTSLQLLSNKSGSSVQYIQEKKLNEVFGSRAHLTRQLARTKRPISKTAGWQTLNVGNEWVTAVRQLMEINKITVGIPMMDLVALLGDPTSCDRTAKEMQCRWYFDTPAHVNPIFISNSIDEVVTGFWLDRR